MIPTHPHLKEMHGYDDEKVNLMNRVEIHDDDEKVNLMNRVEIHDEVDDDEPDLQILARFHDFVCESMILGYSCMTFGELIDNINHLMRPNKKCIRVLEPKDIIEIKEGAMVIYQGKDLYSESLSSTLQQMGMSEQANILIIYPGPFVTRPKIPILRAGPHDPIHPFLRGNAQSSELLYLVETARSAAQAGIPIDKFLENVKAASEKKIIVVEVPISDGIDCLMPLMIKLTDQIDYVKRTVSVMIRRSPGFDFAQSALKVEEFDLFLDNIKLESGSVLSNYGVEEHCKLKLSRKSDVVDISEPLKQNCCFLPRGVKMELSDSDSVRKVKVRVHQVTGTPPKWQSLKYMNNFLGEDCKSLVNFGIRFSLHDLFRCAPRKGALELLPTVGIKHLDAGEGHITKA